MQDHRRTAAVALKPAQVHKMYVARKIRLDRGVAVEGATSRCPHKCTDRMVEVVIHHVRE